MPSANFNSESVILAILRWLRNILLGAVAAAALFYLGDAALYYLRGKPQDQIVVSRYMAAPLKGNKTEYYFEGTGPQDCAQTVFPQDGLTPCWYLRRHPTYADNL